MAAIVVGDGCGVEAVPYEVQYVAAGNGEKRRAKDESEGVDGDVVAHDREEEKPRQTESTQDVDRGCVVASVRRKPEGEEEKGGEQSEGAEAFKEPAERVRIAADERKMRCAVVDSIDDRMESQGGFDVEFEPGTIGDGGELISKECGVGEDVVGLDGKEGEHVGHEVKCGEADGIALAEIDRGEQKAERDKDGIPCGEDGADGGEKPEESEEFSARG